MEAENLTPQQLMAVKAQLEDEIEKLTNSFSQLRHAGTKYRASRIAVDTLDERELLVPLTSSLYVPGRLVDPDKFLVDVGASYYVEKNKADAKEFCERKMLMLKENMDKVSALITQRRRTYEVVMQTLQKRSAESRQDNS